MCIVGPPSSALPKNDSCISPLPLDGLLTLSGVYASLACSVLLDRFGGGGERTSSLNASVRSVAHGRDEEFWKKNRNQVTLKFQGTLDFDRNMQWRPEFWQPHRRNYMALFAGELVFIALELQITSLDLTIIQCFTLTYTHITWVLNC